MIKCIDGEVLDLNAAKNPLHFIDLFTHTITGSLAAYHSQITRA